ncbi:uncharacterized protein LOC132201734 [Neocloeon triangulifer]|uniref:uncharacterized protein LOC132201734 n=1 Tax=Neocloeon triangulifer TaxID=2078957 RepID=UPI00286F938F|nr:uncharacterized protein LOC132201734 [Neocloeon triangulifer]
MASAEPALNQELACDKPRCLDPKNISNDVPKTTESQKPKRRRNKLFVRLPKKKPKKVHLLKIPLNNNEDENENLSADENSTPQPQQDPKLEIRPCKVLLDKSEVLNFLRKRGLNLKDLLNESCLTRVDKVTNAQVDDPVTQNKLTDSEKPKSPQAHQTSMTLSPPKTASAPAASPAPVSQPVSQDSSSSSKCSEVSARRDSAEVSTRFLLKRGHSASKGKEKGYKLIQLPPRDGSVGSPACSSDTLSALADDSSSQEGSTSSTLSTDEGIRGGTSSTGDNASSTSDSLPIKRVKLVTTSKDKKLFYCMPCSENYKDLATLKLHILKYHRECTDVTSVLHPQKKGTDMVKYASGVVLFVACPFCKEFFIDVTAVCDHFVKAHKNESFQEIICSRVPIKVMKVEPLLKMRQKFFCGLCKLTFDEFDLLKRHLRVFHAIFECQICFCFSFISKDVKNQCDACAYRKTVQRKPIKDLNTCLLGESRVMKAQVTNNVQNIVRFRSVTLPSDYTADDNEDMWSSDSVIEDLESKKHNQGTCIITRVMHKTSNEKRPSYSLHLKTIVKKFPLIPTASAQVAAKQPPATVEEENDDDEYGVDALENLLQNMKSSKAVPQPEKSTEFTFKPIKLPNLSILKTQASSKPVTQPGVSKVRAPIQKKKVGKSRELESNECYVEELTLEEMQIAGDVRLNLSLLRKTIRPCPLMPCLYCDRLALDQSDLMDHLIVKHNHCPVCRTVFESKEHFSNHEDIKFYKCSSFLCGQTFHTAEQLARHEEFVHDHEFEYVGEESRAYQFEACEEEDVIHCFYCAEYFETKSVMNEHLIYEHNISLCVECSNYNLNGSKCKYCDLAKA